MSWKILPYPMKLGAAVESMLGGTCRSFSTATAALDSSELAGSLSVTRNGDRASVSFPVNGQQRSLSYENQGWTVDQ